MTLDFYISEPPHVSTEEEGEMILTYVPEAEWLSFGEAWLLARERDWDAAIQLEEDILYG